MYEGNVFGRLDQKLQHAIADAGYQSPTPIQEQAIPHLLAGADLIGCAQTGTGKTAAFMLPILNRLLKVRRPRHIGHPRALVLSPTRELAVQTAENVRRYSKEAGLPFACLIGGVSQYGQVKDIKKGAETIVACPGRLIDLMTQGIVYLDQVECFVLDEADRMLDMGFLPDIKRIISKLPKARQSLLFSATMPAAILKLADELTTDAQRITITPESPTVEKINQCAMLVPKSSRDALLVHLLGERPEWNKVIVFTKMRHGADRICRKLFRAGISCAAIHSDKTQNQRMHALDGFRRGEVRVLVATDIASRGIDVPEVSCVINTEIPMELESYVHRIGRTARAGESGAAITFVTPEEQGSLKALERFIRKTIPVRPLPKGFTPPPDPNGGANGANAAAAKPPRKGGGGDGAPRRKSFLGRRQPDFGQKGE